jgi:hypothetical protein
MRTATLETKQPTLALPKIVISDGTVEVLKWLALICMTCDHVDKYLLHASVPALFDAGRLAMPLFGFVLAYNLARPGLYDAGMYQRAMRRLLLCGVLATPAFVGLGGLLAHWWPLNIMFMLLTVTLTLFLLQRPGWPWKVAAIAVFVIGGSSVEFWWPAVGFCVASWSYCKRPSWSTLVIAVSCCAALAIINGNSWALAALPVIYAATRFHLRMPRVRYAFYAYYPVHLTMIWAICTLSS